MIGAWDVSFLVMVDCSAGFSEVSGTDVSAGVLATGVVGAVLCSGSEVCGGVVGSVDGFGLSELGAGSSLLLGAGGADVCGLSSLSGAADVCAVPFGFPDSGLLSS